ncbi:hypothetical protein GCM10025860_05110 [Methanobacterium ferruginis]|nr:hypothetical protein GCM10025860_05110 [Methanobacterium ferruginis]
MKEGVKGVEIYLKSKLLDVNNSVYEIIYKLCGFSDAIHDYGM